MIEVIDEEKGKILNLHFKPTERGFIHKGARVTADGVRQDFELELYKIDGELVLYMDEYETRKGNSADYHDFKAMYDIDS